MKILACICLSVLLAGCAKKAAYVLEYTHVTVASHLDMRVMTSGPFRYESEDIHTFFASTENREIGVKIRDGYTIGIREFDSEDLPGFGLLIRGPNLSGQSWEWYRMGESDRADKLQGSGDVLVETLVRSNCTYISKVTFLEDAVFRLSYPRQDRTDPLDAFASCIEVDELFIIREGSVLVFHEQ
jgi:hypothetical protein